MSLVFNTPKSALNTTSKEIQNLATDCPPCPECPEVQLETADVEYTSNGEYTITPEGDGFSSVDVTVNVDVTTPYNEGYAAGETAGIATGKTQGAAEQKAKLTSLNVTENGSYNREDGYNAVTVNVQPDLQAKTVTPTTSQQVITPDQGKDGLSEVTVSGVTAAIDQNITASNIKDGVTILGVTGTYDPQPSLESKTASYTANGTYTINPSSGYDGMSDVEVTVNVSGGSGTQCPDWSSIGWDCNDVNASGIDADIAYTAEAKAYYERTEGFNTYNSLVFAPVFENGVSSFSNLFGTQSKLKYVPNVYLNSNPRDYSATRMFYSCSSLTRIHNIDTSEITDMSNMFYGCSSLTEAPNIDTSSATSFNHMFTSCSISTVPQYNTQSLQNAANFLNVNVNKLVSIPQLNFVSVNNIANVIGQNNQNNLTTLGGFTNLGKAFISTDAAIYHLLDLSKAPNLTKQSIMNVINNLAAPDDTNVTNATLKLSAASYALLSAEDIAIATAKRWSVVSA